MRVRIDGADIFGSDVSSFEAAGWRRKSEERSVAGLRGAMNVDLGFGSRKITQTGVLCGCSKSVLRETRGLIESYLDGKSHTLIVDEEEYADILVDEFTVSEVIYSGSGARLKYRIVYRQLSE
jgi:hypothetical protein